MKLLSSRHPWFSLAVVFLVAGFLATQPLHGQDCRILSLDRSGLLVWTNSHTNIFAGFQYVDRLGTQWQPAPPPFWNFRLTNFANYAQIPPEAMDEDQLYLRLVISTNDLGSGLPVYQVPQRTIVVDGNTNDWSGVSPAIVDPVGDGNELVGSDITALFLARDAQNIYARIDLTDGPPSSSLFFGIVFHREDSVGTRFIFIQMNPPRCSVDEFVDENFNHTLVATGLLAVNQGLLELSVPASALNPPSPSVVKARNDASGHSIDETLMIEARYAP